MRWSLFRAPSGVSPAEMLGHHEGSVRLARYILGAIILVLLAHLCVATKPWNLGIEERLAAHRRPTLTQMVDQGLYWASAINLVCCVVLWASARWWTRPLPVPSTPPAGRRRQPAWFWLLLVGAMVLGGVLRWPLAHRSLWWDEAWPLRNAILGERTVDKENPDKLVFHKRRWEHAFWNYQTRPTNHVTFSICARACLKTWQSLRGKKPYEFDEFVMRLPAYIPGVLSIVLIGAIVATSGFRWAGVASAFILALHPWHIRYSADARCYALVVFFTLLATWALTHALRTSRVRYWAIYALTHFLLVWSFPYAIYLTAAMAAVALVAIVFHRGWTPTSLVFATRLTIAKILCTMCTLQMLLPLVVQMPYWGEKVRLNEPVDVSRFGADFWSYITAGVAYENHSFGPETAWYPSVVRLAAANGWIKPILFGLIPFLVAVGLIALLRRREPLAWPMLAIFFAAAGAVAMAVVLVQAITPRFLIFALPAVVVTALIGVETIIGLCSSWMPRLSRFLPPAIFAVTVLAFSQLTHAERKLVMTRPISPARDAVQFMLQQTSSDPAKSLRVGFGNWADTPIIYDAYLKPIGTRDELITFCQRSLSEGKPLYVFYCNNLLNRQRVPEAFVLLDDRRLFEKVATFEGLADRDYHTVLRFTGSDLPANAAVISDSSDGSPDATASAE